MAIAKTNDKILFQPGVIYGLASYFDSVLIGIPDEAGNVVLNVKGQGVPEDDTEIVITFETIERGSGDQFEKVIFWKEV